MPCKEGLVPESEFVRDNPSVMLRMPAPFAQGSHGGGAYVGCFSLYKRAVKEEKGSLGGRRIAARSLHKRVIKRGKKGAKDGGTPGGMTRCDGRGFFAGGAPKGRGKRGRENLHL